MALPFEGGGTTTAQIAAYSAANGQVSGNQTAQEQQTISEVEAAVTTIAAGWADSGGTGGRQAALALEVLAFAGRIEAARITAISQHAEKASGGTLQARHAQAEIHGADTAFMVEMYRQLIELRERVNDSPY